MLRMSALLKTVSKIFYWISMISLGLCAFSILSGYEAIYAYAYALGSVVSMMVSSILVYFCNLLSVGADVIKREEPPGEKVALYGSSKEH